MKDVKKLPAYFLLALVLVSLYFGYLIFEPYIAVIIMGALFALLFYRPYSWLRSKLKGWDSIAALLTVIVFVLIVLIPVGNFIALLVKESIETYPTLAEKFTSGEAASALSRTIDNIKDFQKAYLPFLDLEGIDFRQVILDIGNKFSNFLINNASTIVGGTTSFIISLFFMLLTMYYFLKDGEHFFQRVMYLTPLPNKYDVQLFEKFRDVGKSTIIGSLVTALVQGGLAALAFIIIGLPPLFLGVATGVASLIPVVGTGLVLVPVIVILAVSANWFGAIFLLIYGMVVIGLSDNLIRTYVIGSQSNIHPLLVFFSIFGGVALWGALGIIFGPLVLALILTVLHIYELEYDKYLDK